MTLKPVLGLLLLLMFSTSSFAVNCQNPSTVNCDFYTQCLEKKIPCGAEGYALGYGDKYCRKFKAGNFKTVGGKGWRDKTLVCLQRALPQLYASQPYASCQKVKDHAFDSHSPCYLDPEPGLDLSICWIPAEDIREAVRIVDLVDALSPGGLSQSFSVATVCIREYWNEFSINTSYTHMSHRKKSKRKISDEELYYRIKVMEELRAGRQTL